MLSGYVRIGGNKGVLIMIWFTSDTHFGHANAIKFTNRPFKSVEEMEKVFVRNINQRVKFNDHLYHLGDFSFRMSADDAKCVRERIRCKNVHLIKGNHDKNWQRAELEGAFLLEPLVCNIKLEDGQKFSCCHYPMLDWPSLRHGAIHLHGHIHSSREYNLWNRENGDLRFDVGVDANDYAPVSMEEILDFFKGVDFNTRRDWRNWSMAPTPEIEEM